MSGTSRAAQMTVVQVPSVRWLKDALREREKRVEGSECQAPLPGAHPLLPGTIISSPGGSYRYRIIGACCRLFDRETLPYPSCSLEWRGKQPSWRRIGRRFVADMATMRSPSYSVELLDFPGAPQRVMTIHWVSLSETGRLWWHSPTRSRV